MALVHPTKPVVRPLRGELHPAVGLLAGFAVLVAVATVVHLIFGLF